MTLLLNLSSELEEYLLQSAEKCGLSVEEMTLQMLAGCMQEQHSIRGLITARI